MLAIQGTHPLTTLPRTLIADDEPDILTALQLLLKTEGYQAETVSSPAAVLEAIGRSHFDVVLMDLNYARDTTSGREGLDLISRIHALDPLLPIIVMTAWGSVDLAVEAMRRGVRDFVQKPWENSRLLQTLGKQVKHARARRSVQSGMVKTQLKIKRELAEARELQENLLSTTTLSLLPGVHIDSSWQPASTVGGDYVAVFSINERRAALCVADVAGKGLPAALLMSNFQAGLKSAALADLPPALVCARLNRFLHSNMPLHKFITGFYGVLDLEKRTLVFTNAGHNPPLLVRANGDFARLDAGGSVLGAFPESVYSEDDVELKSGDRLVIFTDGLTEVVNGNGEQFGEDHLLGLVCQHRELEATKLKQMILEEVSRFCRNSFQDDVTLMVVAVD